MGKAPAGAAAGVTERPAMAIRPPSPAELKARSTAVPSGSLPLAWPSSTSAGVSWKASCRVVAWSAPPGARMASSRPPAVATAWIGPWPAPTRRLGSIAATIRPGPWTFAEGTAA